MGEDFHVFLFLLISTSRLESLAAVELRIVDSKCFFNVIMYEFVRRGRVVVKFIVSFYT